MDISRKPGRKDDKPDDSLAGFARSAYYSTINWYWYKAMFAILTIVTILSSQVALLHILAYEFSAVIGLIICHFSGVVVVREIFRIKPRVAERSPYTPGPQSRIVVWGVILGCFLSILWLLLVPLVLIVTLDLVLSIRNCDLLTGLGYYFGIPLVSAIFSVSVATFSALSSRNIKAAWFLYTGVVLIFLVRIVCKIAFGHTIGLHDPYIGLLNLPLYDQEANLDSGFIYSRLLVLVFSKLLINISIMFADSRNQYFSTANFFTNLKDNNRFLPEIETGIFTLVLLILGLYYSGPLGIDISRRYLEHVLDGKLVTEHFIIRYPTGSEVEKDLVRVAEDTEYYYHSIEEVIQVAPDRLIRAYIYRGRSSKTFLTGVGSGVYAKPWTGEIHVEYQRSGIEALKHELVHVLSAPMGVPFFGSSMLGAYGEGIAEGVAWDTGNDLSYHQWAAALREADDPYSDGPFFPRENYPLWLLTRNTRPGGFYAGRIGMNYYLSASHTKWFIDTYGIDAYNQVYMRDDTVRAINQSQADTADQWMDYLDHVPLNGDDIAFAGFGFAPPKFTVRVCAHELAEHERLATEYAARQEYANTVAEYELLLKFSPRNIRYGYRVATYLYYGEKYTEALDKITELREWESADAGWHAYLDQLEGDIYARSGRIEEARIAYEKARDSSINESLEYVSTLRLDILESPARDEFLSALQDNDKGLWFYERANSIDSGWLASYYIGLNLINNRDYDLAREYFLECVHSAPPHLFVERNALYYLGICAYREGQYLLATENFTAASQVADTIFRNRHPTYDGVIPVDRLDTWYISCMDWIDRTNWRSEWKGIE
jgi:tetratricopeptide (TPR) repeat protein